MEGVVEIEGAHDGCQLDHRATMEGNVAQGSPVAIKVGASDMVEAVPVRGDADHKALDGVHAGAEFINYGLRAARAPGHS
jgi:hypothetical protein